MATSQPGKAQIRVADLNDRASRPFLIVPEADQLTALGAELGLSALRKLRFEGQLHPDGSRGWRLAGHIGATVVQPCVVTLAPVTTRVEEDVLRIYTPDIITPAQVEDDDGEGAPMPEDDALEPLPAVIDLEEVMAEALALALPQYPRAEDVELGEAVYTKKGTKPMTDEDIKPFAGLAGLRAKLAGGSPEEDPQEDKD